MTKGLLGSSAGATRGTRWVAGPAKQMILGASTTTVEEGQDGGAVADRGGGSVRTHQTPTPNPLAVPLGPRRTEMLAAVRGSRSLQARACPGRGGVRTRTGPRTRNAIGGRASSDASAARTAARSLRRPGLESRGPGPAGHGAPRVAAGASSPRGAGGMAGGATSRDSEPASTWGSAGRVHMEQHRQPAVMGGGEPSRTESTSSCPGQCTG